MKNNLLERERVRRSTSPVVNQRIDDTISETIHAYVDASETELTQRLADLDREWDIERVLQFNASSLALTGIALGVTRDRRWLALSSGVLGFLLYHAVKGWCPPMPVLRRLGLRTRSEIDRERIALKFLRGDFDNVYNGDGGLNLARLMQALES